jgi:hypothetical protein
MFGHFTIIRDTEMAFATEGKSMAHAVDKPAFEYSQAKRRILIFLLAYDAALVGMWNFMPKDDRILDFLVGLPILIPVVIWCHLDAKERKQTIGVFMKLGLIFLFVLAFPIYIFQTQGPGGFKTLSFATFFASGTAVVLLLRVF